VLCGLAAIQEKKATSRSPASEAAGIGGSSGGGFGVSALPKSGRATRRRGDPALRRANTLSAPPWGADETLSDSLQHPAWVRL